MPRRGLHNVGAAAPLHLLAYKLRRVIPMLSQQQLNKPVLGRTARLKQPLPAKPPCPARYGDATPRSARTMTHQQRMFSSWQKRIQIAIELWDVASFEPYRVIVQFGAS